METGQVERGAEGWRATLIRALPQSTGSVWDTLTKPALFSKWLAQGTIELQQGGAVNLEFEGSGTVIDSSVTEYDEGSLLAFNWSRSGEPGRMVRLLLSPAGTGSLLEVSLTLPDDEDIAKHCAGWEAHLAMLQAALDGVPMEFPFELFMQARQAYSGLI